jgi:hypothetical protein
VASAARAGVRMQDNVSKTVRMFFMVVSSHAGFPTESQRQNATFRHD